jgi:hypothetical protein
MDRRPALQIRRVSSGGTTSLVSNVHFAGNPGGLAVVGDVPARPASSRSTD